MKALKIGDDVKVTLGNPGDVDYKKDALAKIVSIKQLHGRDSYLVTTSFLVAVANLDEDGNLVVTSAFPIQKGESWMPAMTVPAAAASWGFKLDVSEAA